MVLTMQKFKSKKISVNFFLFIFLTCLIITQLVSFYGFEKNEKILLDVNFSNSDGIDDQLSDYYQKSINIHYPKRYDYNDLKSPIVILIHGDFVDSKAFNLLKRQYIANGFIVVTQEFDFTISTFKEINETINYLQQQQDLDGHEIGIVGHSHGAHYAYFMSIIRSDAINFVICANFGSRYQIYRDFYPYYDNYVMNISYDIFWDFERNYQFSISESTPANLLVITDTLDPNYLHYSQINQSALKFWDIDQENVFYGNFELGSAKLFKLYKSAFIHTSGIYHPEAIAKEIEWISYSTAYEYSKDNSQNLWDSRLNLILIFLIVIIGIQQFRVMLHLIFHNKLLVRQINEDLGLYHKLYYQKTDLDLIFKNKLNINQSIESNNIDPADFDNLINFRMKIFFKYVILMVMMLVLLLNGIILFFNPDLAIIYYPPIFNFIPVLLTNFTNYLSQMLFLGPLSFNFMYFWVILIIFIQSTSIPSLLEVQFKRLTWKNIKLSLLIFLQLFASFWVFFYFVLYQWIGLNPNNSILNIIMRYLIIFYLNHLVLEFFSANKQKIEMNIQNLLLILQTIMFFVVLFFPIYFPTLSSYNLFLNYFVLYIFPLLLIPLFNALLMYMGKSINFITFIDYFILIFRKLLISSFTIVL